jgi:hypothetical protein
MFNLKLEITEDVLENIFVTAIEGGSDYWAYITRSDAFKKFKETSKDYSFSENVLKFVLSGGDMVVEDVEEEGEVLGSINKANIELGLNTLLNSPNKQHLFAMLNEDYDAENADVCFQYIVLNDLVYG